MNPTDGRFHSSKILLAALFAVSFAYVEASVVVYLRQIMYPTGFSFPLKDIPTNLIIIELVRELATMLMLGTVAWICARKPWERFGFFILVFGVWDIFYYIWLKATINWPLTLVDWDILFLIPVPWIGPVIAPVLVSCLMIAVGVLVIRLCQKRYTFKPSAVSWGLATIGTGVILFSFMRDFAAAYERKMPQPYWYPLLFAGLLCYIAAFLIPYREAQKSVGDQE